MSDTDTAQVNSSVPVGASEVGIRIVSAAIAMALGAIGGFYVGRWGDNKDRKMAEQVFPIIGGAFGLLLSLYATKREDRRSYENSEAPPAKPPEPKALTQVQHIAREGRLEEEKPLARAH